MWVEGAMRLAIAALAAALSVASVPLPNARQVEFMELGACCVCGPPLLLFFSWRWLSQPFCFPQIKRRVYAIHALRNPNGAFPRWLLGQQGWRTSGATPPAPPLRKASALPSPSRHALPLPLWLAPGGVMGLSAAAAHGCAMGLSAAAAQGCASAQRCSTTGLRERAMLWA